MRVKQARVLGKNRNILKLNLANEHLNIDGIYLSDIEKVLEVIKEKYGDFEYNKFMNGENNIISLDIIYYPDINEYMGRKTV